MVYSVASKLHVKDKYMYKKIYFIEIGSKNDLQRRDKRVNKSNDF